MNIVIIGSTCSGKTALAKELERNDGYKRIVTYTTRPIREGEVDGVDYHFITNEEFDRLVSEGFFLEHLDYDANFGRCQYGSAKEDYRTDEDWVVVLNPSVADFIKYMYPDTRVVYLKPSINIIKKRAEFRGDDLEEIDRRLRDDQRFFKKVSHDNLYDLKIYDSCVDLKFMIRRVKSWLKYILPQKEVSDEYIKFNTNTRYEGMF